MQIPALLLLPRWVPVCAETTVTGALDRKEEALALRARACYSLGMKLNGSYQFPIDSDRLWAALMDPETVGACIPGVQSFAAVGPDTYAFEVGFRVGIVSGAYKGTLEVRDVDAPNSYHMIVQGTGVRTDMRGEGTVALIPGGEGSTTLTFDGEVNVTGILARVGQRMMGAVAKQQIDRLFQCLRAKAV